MTRKVHYPHGVGYACGRPCTQRLLASTIMDEVTCEGCLKHLQFLQTLEDAANALSLSPQGANDIRMHYTGAVHLLARLSPWMRNNPDGMDLIEQAALDWVAHGAVNPKAWRVLRTSSSVFIEAVN